MPNSSLRQDLASFFFFFFAQDGIKLRSSNLCLLSNCDYM
jgi:hypothetical protein